MQRLLNKILIADDDPAMLRLLAAHLKSGGYDVCTANNGREALELIEQLQPSYLIADWEMPEIDGLELCRRVRKLKLSGYLYVVMVTGRSGQLDLMEAMAAGADDFLRKPILQGELMARLSAGARMLDLECRLSQLADHDALTELPTRRAFDQFLTKEWARCRRYQMPLTAVMLDIDFFKQVNDTYGHATGDAVIRAVAEILAKHTRACDILCRYGGEEFCVLLPETDEASAIIWAQRFRQRVAEAAVVAGGTSITVTVSLGVAEMFAEMDAQGDLLALADQCLLAAKDQGRNRVVSFRALAASGTLGIDGSTGDESGLEGVLARDVMIPLFYCVRADWTVARAAAYLLQFRVSSVPVTNEEGCLLGIVSEKDVLRVAHKTEAPLRHVQEILRSNVISYADTTPLRQILSFLTRASIRSVIITREGKPCGLISRAAVVRWFLENRWNLEPPDLGLGPGWARSAESLSNEPDLLGSMTEALVRLAAQMRSQLQGQAAERDQAAIVGGASRMQQLLDELLCASSLRPVGAGLPC